MATPSQRGWYLVPGHRVPVRVMDGRRGSRHCLCDAAYPDLGHRHDIVEGRDSSRVGVVT